MKRSGFKPRTTSLKAHKPMARGASTLRMRKPASAKPKRAAREREDRDLADLCHGQDCYLQMPGICCTGRETVVPAHSNQYRHGKAKGIKAHHRFTVPGCHACHAELDQGMRFTREEKFALWDAAYARWEPIRDALTTAHQTPIHPSITTARAL